MSMSERKTLKCEVCGKTIGYIKLGPQSYMKATPAFDNVKVSAICTDDWNKMHKVEAAPMT
jgi:hypothetical protein